MIKENAHARGSLYVNDIPLHKKRYILHFSKDIISNHLKVNITRRRRADNFRHKLAKFIKPSTDTHREMLKKKMERSLYQVVHYMNMISEDNSKNSKNNKAFKSILYGDGEGDIDTHIFFDKENSGKNFLSYLSGEKQWEDFMVEEEPTKQENNNSEKINEDDLSFIKKLSESTSSDHDMFKAGKIMSIYLTKPLNEATNEEQELFANLSNEKNRFYKKIKKTSDIIKFFSKMKVDLSKYLKNEENSFYTELSKICEIETLEIIKGNIILARKMIRLINNNKEDIKTIKDNAINEKINTLCKALNITSFCKIHLSDEYNDIDIEKLSEDNKNKPVDRIHVDYINTTLLDDINLIDINNNLITDILFLSGSDIEKLTQGDVKNKINTLYDEINKGSNANAKNIINVANNKSNAINSNEESHQLLATTNYLLANKLFFKEKENIKNNNKIPLFNGVDKKKQESIFLSESDLDFIKNIKEKENVVNDELLIPIKPLKSTLAHLEEFKNNVNIQKNVVQLNMRMPYLRGVKGDGNCFYRSFAFTLVKSMLIDSCKNKNSEIDHLKTLLNFIDSSKNAGKFKDICTSYSLAKHKISQEDIKKMPDVLMQGLKALSLQAQSDTFSATDIDNAIQNVFNKFPLFDQAMVLLTRLLAQEGVRFIENSDAKLKNDNLKQLKMLIPILKENINEIATYGVEAEEMVGKIVAEAMHVPTTINYIDKDDKAGLIMWKYYQQKKTDTEPVFNDTLELYYRRGHYDIGYSIHKANMIYPLLTEEMVKEQMGYLLNCSLVKGKEGVNYLCQLTALYKEKVMKQTH